MRRRLELLVEYIGAFIILVLLLLFGLSMLACRNGRWIIILVALTIALVAVMS